MGLDREPLSTKIYSVGAALSLAVATLAQTGSAFAEPLNDGTNNQSGSGKVEVEVSYSLPHEYGGVVLPPHADVKILEKGIDTRPLGSWGFLKNLDSSRKIVFMYEGATARPNGAFLHQRVNNIRGSKGEGAFEFIPGRYAVEIVAGEYSLNYPIMGTLLARTEFLVPEFPESNAAAAEIISRIYPQMGQTEGLENFPAYHKIEIRVITDRNGNFIHVENRDKTAENLKLELEKGKGPKSLIRQEWTRTQRKALVNPNYNPKIPR